MLEVMDSFISQHHNSSQFIQFTFRGPIQDSLSNTFPIFKTILPPKYGFLDVAASKRNNRIYIYAALRLQLFGYNIFTIFKNDRLAL